MISLSQTATATGFHDLGPYELVFRSLGVVPLFMVSGAVILATAWACAGG